MKTFFYLTIFSVSLLISCKKESSLPNTQLQDSENTIQHASGLAIYPYQNFSKVKITTPWPDAKEGFTYILRQKNALIPDSLQKYPTIQVPLQSVVVTSTTNIPFLEMLGVENKLKGFPHTDYVSSPKTRALIQKGLVKNVGQNENLNVEQLLDIAPDLIITFGVNNNNAALMNLEKSGLKTLVQADWMEQSPLGKAEWIKLFGALFCKEKEAKSQFDQIVFNYKNAVKIASKVKNAGTVMYGSMYEEQWYVARGESWISQYITDAKATYLWKDLKGSGSEPLSFENVFQKGQKANYWITSAFSSLDAMTKTNAHYEQFDAFQNKHVYTFEGKKGLTGGIVFYELGPSRPDLVLKDYIKIFHPEVIPNYEFTFAQKIN